VVATYGIGIAGTLLLALPVARRGPGGAELVDALFTATSSISLTGLAVVDTGSHWTGFGQAVILGLVQVGGLGIMTLTSVLAVLLARRLGVRARMNVVAEAPRHRGGRRPAGAARRRPPPAPSILVVLMFIGRLGHDPPTGRGDRQAAGRHRDPQPARRHGGRRPPAR
jgi:Trk-type K+ transport system membrane component